MKISELSQIANVRRDIRIPLSVQGENHSITLGQILDAISQDVMPFGGILDNDVNVQYVPGSPEADTGTVIYDKVNEKFYLSVEETIESAGVTLSQWTYLENWSTRSGYYTDDGEVRTDCLFLEEGGRLYFFNGDTLRSAGVTDTQAVQIRHSTPVEVESEEEMARRIAAGLVETGQLYFVAE